MPHGPMPEHPPAAPAPERVVIERVFRPADWAAFVALSAFGLAALGWFWTAWLHDGLGGQPWLRLLMIGVLLALLVNQQGRWLLLLPMRRPRPMPAPTGLRVAVVTTFVPGAESVEMVEATLRAMTAMRYPHDSWLLDEGDDPDVRAACERLGVRHFSRKGEPTLATDEGPFRAKTKHGNYNAWLHAVGFANYDVLVAFDPDHVPEPEYLDGVLGYFRDPGVGYVQVAQAYYNQDASFIARGAAEETYAYFSAIQMAGYGMGYPIIVGGHNAHRMEALRAMGGLAAHDADDLMLTLRYRAAGWQGVYHPAILARGLTPVDWRGYLVQQRRWARSVLDLKFRHNGPFARKLPLRSRAMSLLHGLNFLHRSLAHALLALVLVYLCATGRTIALLTERMLLPSIALALVLAMQEFFRQRFYLDWTRESGLHWRGGLLGFAKWPWFLLAIADAVTGREVGYVVTRKASSAGIYWPFVTWQLGLAGTIGLAWWLGSRGPGESVVVAAIGASVATVAVGLALHALRAPPASYEPARARSSVASVASTPSEFSGVP